MALPKSLMKEAARHLAPFLSLALAVDHEIDCHAKTSKLLAEPRVLITAALEVRLNNEQV